MSVSNDGFDVTFPAGTIDGFGVGVGVSEGVGIGVDAG